MKVSKITKNKKIIKKLNNNLFPSLYNQDAYIPAHPMNGILDIIQKDYQRKTIWSDDDKNDLKEWIASLLVDYSLRKVNDTRGIKAIRILNMYYLYEYLIANLPTQVVKANKLKDEYKKTKEKLIYHIYSGLVELKHVSSLEYPYLSPPNEFWKYRFKYLKKLPFDMLSKNLGNRRSLIEFTRSKIGASYKQEINYLIFPEDVNNCSFLIEKIEIINIVRESFTPNQAKEIKKAIKRSKLIKDFEIDLSKIIKSIE